MKLKNIIIGSAIFAAGIGALSLSSCNESHAGNQITNATSISAVEQIPYLKARKAGLGSKDEIAHVAGIFDAQKEILKKDNQNAEAWLKLAELFVNEARISGDHPYYYPAALQMIASIPNLESRSLETQFEAASLKSSVLLSQHEFAKALQVAESAVKIFPMNAGIHGALIDAEVELGNYEKAVEYSDRMVSLRPDLRSYSRISYLREIHGDPEGAIEAMKMAVDAGMPGYEQTAWCRLTLAKLYERYGKLDEAKMHYTIVLQERPEYPFATAGLASIAMKQGNFQEAEQLLDKAIGMIPEVAFYESKVELMNETGRTEESKKMCQEILTMMAEDQESGHKMDLELAAVQLRLLNDASAAEKYAKVAYSERPQNIDVNAMLAKIEYVKGNFIKAHEYDVIAMRTGSKDPQKNIVSGLIKLELGEVATGKAQIKAAFAQDPYLSGALVKTAKSKI